MNNPKECPKQMETPIRLLEAHLSHITGTDPDTERLVFHRVASPQRETDTGADQVVRAIALLKAHESMCECGAMPNDGNAAVNDLERSLATHREMLVAFQGSPKGEYHAKCIREIEAAIHVVKACDGLVESLQKACMAAAKVTLRCIKCGLDFRAPKGSTAAQCPICHPTP